MRKTEPGSIDEYVAGFPPEVQKILSSIWSTIREVAPEAEEKISYQMPTFFLAGNLVHFAAHKEHVGFYPAPSAILKFQVELAAYKTSKGAVQFPLDKPVPFDLIRRIVRFRVGENLEKAAARGKRPSGS